MGLSLNGICKGVIANRRERNGETTGLSVRTEVARCRISRYLEQPRELWACITGDLSTAHPMVMRDQNSHFMGIDARSCIIGSGGHNAHNCAN